MDTKDIPKDGPSDWRREPSERLNALILKLGEESGELSVRCIRAAMQGIREIDPDSKRTNLAHIEDEIADVCAQLQLFGEFIEVNSTAITDREKRKYRFKLPWIKALPDQSPNPER